MDDLIKSLERKEPQSALIARRIGPSAAPVLRDMARHPDPKVRRLSFYALTETGGEGAALAFAEGMLDTDAQVRGAAMGGLLVHNDPAAANKLFDVYDLSRHPEVREHAALCIGALDLSKAPDPRLASAQELARRYKEEKDPVAADGGLAALARLGDENARRTFGERLGAARGEDQRRFLRHARYIGQPWLIKPLRPLLADKSNFERIGVDARPDLPHYLRVCDEAANIIILVGKPAKLSFKPGEPIVYTDAQLDEVGRFADSLP